MINPPMQASYDGIRFTETEEGGKPNADGNYDAYWDAIGKVATIGPGLTGTMQDGTPITMGLTLTQAQVDTEVTVRYASIVASLNEALQVRPTQGEFNAFCDIEWNEGQGAITKSTMLKLWNEGDVMGCRNQFVLWDKAGGSVIVGLMNRRIAEQGEYDA